MWQLFKECEIIVGKVDGKWEFNVYPQIIGLAFFFFFPLVVTISILQEVSSSGSKKEVNGILIIKEHRSKTSNFFSFPSFSYTPTPKQSPSNGGTSSGRNRSLQEAEILTSITSLYNKKNCGLKNMGQSFITFFSIYPSNL